MPSSLALRRGGWGEQAARPWRNRGRAGPSVAERLKHGWSETSAVAYEYVNILDVMVGQAPEYVGLVYGAIKILLVAQVNNEEVKDWNGVRCKESHCWIRISITDLVPSYVAHVNLEKLTRLKFPLDAIGKLVIPDKNKQLLVKAIEAVQTQTNDRHVAPAASDTDPRPNITDRLFLLFHGAPGMGRSLVAQCLANYARRPLFHVTSGTKLVDHVDTVLENRNFSDFDKNAVVTDRLWSGVWDKFRKANMRYLSSEMLNLIEDYRSKSICFQSYIKCPEKFDWCKYPSEAVLASLFCVAITRLSLFS